MNVELINISPNAEEKIVEIARVSSSRKDKTEQPEGLINYLIKNRHWSPFEHGYMTLKIVTSKAIGIQLLRHRSFTFQEFSQRYSQVTKVEDIEFRLQAKENRQSSEDYVGDIKQLENSLVFEYKHDFEITKGQSYAIKIAAEALDDCLNAYHLLLESGIAKECARMILPMATQTTIYMTGNVRSWIHLIGLRDDSHAQKEAQLIGKEMKRIFKEQFPIIFNAVENNKAWK